MAPVWRSASYSNMLVFRHTALCRGRPRYPSPAQGCTWLLSFKKPMHNSIVPWMLTTWRNANDCDGFQPNRSYTLDKQLTKH